MSKSYRLLDCTLRDGGHVNDFNFGFEKIKRISKGLVDTGLDIVELGFFRSCDYDEDKTLFNKVTQAEKIVRDLEPKKTKFSMMIRPDWCDISLLDASDRISIIRFAFHKRDIDLVQAQAQRAISLGYEVYLNPVNITGYQDSEIVLMLEKLSSLKVSGVSIVDTFGCMNERDLYRLCELFSRNLDENTELGLHLHENLSLSFSLAQKFLEIRDPKRSVIVDSSTLGMGRIPGNLPTELMVEFLNTRYADSYCLSSVLQVASSEIKPIKAHFDWGYSPEYAVSAALGIHRTFPEYLVSDCGLGFHEAHKVMRLVKERGLGASFSKEVCNQLVRELRGNDQCV